MSDPASPDKWMAFANRHARAVMLSLVLCAGVLILFPRHDFEPWLDPGDHGRDVYAFERSMHGETPYRDYFWQYGPLMPFVYGGFDRALGCRISSIAIGRQCFTLLAAVFLCLAVSELFAPMTAFLVAVWYLVFFPDFWHTFNHTGGMAMIAAILWSLFAYVRSSKPRDAFLGLLWGFILALIKLNFGVVAVAMCMAGVFLTDKFKQTPWSRSKTIFYATAAGLIPVLTCAVYAWCLRGLSLVDIQQCLPYFGGYDPHTAPLLDSLKKLARCMGFAMQIDPIHGCMGVVIGCSAVRTIYLLAARKLEPGRRGPLILALIILVLFYVGNLHEFLRSNIGYRSLWGRPLIITLGFVLIDTALSGTSRLLRWVTHMVILFLMVMMFASSLRIIRAARTPAHYLSCQRAGIYLGCEPELVQCVEAATAFLNSRLKDNELFLALPYDPLYYYLTGRRSPTRQLMFFRHIRTTPEQEEAVIADIERHQINYVLLGNLYDSKEDARALGTLGETHCLKIGRYLKDHFAPVARFGDWTHPPGGLWNHGVVILQRKEPAATRANP
jgi:hypothetical protein